MTYFSWLSVRTYRLPASSRHHRKSDERRAANENMMCSIFYDNCLLTSNFVSIAKSGLFYARQHLDYWLCWLFGLLLHTFLLCSHRKQSRSCRNMGNVTVIMAKCHLACSLLITAPYSVQFQVCIVRTIRYPARLSWALTLTSIHVCAAGPGTRNERLAFHRKVLRKILFLF